MSAQPPSSPRPFTGWHMLVIMLAFFGVVIAVNVTLAVLANKTWSGLVVENGYVASQKFNRELERQKAQASLGWSAEVVPAIDQITVNMRDASQRPLTGLEVQARLFRTVTEAQDQNVLFRETDAGVYRATQTVAPGKWSIDLAARDVQGHVFMQTYHFLVEPKPQ